MIRRENSENLGNYTVASQSVKRGTTISCHIPLVTILYQSNRCSTCFSSTALQTCARCKEVVYCSRSCQKVGWIEGCHKEWCGNEGSDWTMEERLIARLGFVMQKNGTEQQVFETLLESSDYGISVRIADCIAPKTGFSKEDIIIWSRKNLRNSFTILDDCFREIGLGIYPSASANYNHSCWPNAVYTFKGREMIIKAIWDLEPNSEIRIAYLDIRKPEKERKLCLKEVYSFNCICEACQGSGGMKFIRELRRTADSQHRVINIGHHIELARPAIDSVLKNYTNISTDWVSLEINYFNTVPELFNYQAIRLCTERFEDCLAKRDWSSATKYGLLVLNFYLHILPLGYPVIAIFAGDLSAVMFNERHSQKRGEDINFIKAVAEFAKWNLQDIIQGPLLDNIELILQDIEKLE